MRFEQSGLYSPAQGTGPMSRIFKAAAETLWHKSAGPPRPKGEANLIGVSAFVQKEMQATHLDAY